MNSLRSNDKLGCGHPVVDPEYQGNKSELDSLSIRGALKVFEQENNVFLTYL